MMGRMTKKIIKIVVTVARIKMAGYSGILSGNQKKIDKRSVSVKLLFKASC